MAVLNWRDLDHTLAGGSEQYAWEFARALVDGGAQVTFMTSRDRGQTRRARVQGIEVLRGGGRFGYYLWVALTLLRLRRRLDAVVDVENGVPQFSPLFVRRSCRVVLVMHHVHLDQFGVYFPRPLAVLGRFLEGRVMPRLYRRARAVAISHSTVAEMRERLGWQTPVTVLENGTAFSVVEGAEPGPETADRLLVLGRVVAHKRVDEVVAALPALLVDRPGLHLDICGRGPAEDDVRRTVEELGLRDRVTLHGFVPEERMQELIRGARLHLCASDAEGWGLVVLEAAAYGVPSLARHVPGLRESIVDGTTGWLLPDDGRPVHAQLSEGIRAALAELDDDVRRSEMAAQCRAWSGRFTWERMHGSAREILAEELGVATIPAEADEHTGPTWGDEGTRGEHTNGPLAG